MLVYKVYKPARVGDGGDGQEQDRDVKVGATLGDTEVSPLEQHPETSVLGCSEVRKTSVMVASQPVCCSSTISGCFWGHFSTWESPLISLSTKVERAIPLFAVEAEHLVGSPTSIAVAFHPCHPGSDTEPGSSQLSFAGQYKGKLIRAGIEA